MQKKIVILVAILFLTDGLKAQGKYGVDSVNCVINLSLYREYYKQKNYDDALKPWRWVYNNCPSSSGNIFKNGPTLIKYIIKKYPENKAAYTDTLMMIYNKRIQFFGNEGYVLGRKGADLIKYAPERFEEGYDILNKAIDLQQNRSEAGTLLAYFKSSVLMEKNARLDKQKVLDSYARVADIIDYNISNNSKKDKYLQASEIIESLFAPYANCNDLVKIFAAKFDASTEDVDFLIRITKLLDSKECAQNQLYFDAATRLHELAPSALSASKMGKLNVVKNNYTLAVDYFTQAVELEEDVNVQARYYLELADAYRISGSYSRARMMAFKSLELRPDWGEPYISIANIYISSAGSRCASSEFEKESVYWVAVDKFIQAKSIDESLTQKANKAIATYSKYFPNTESCFFNGVESGQNYKVECWINETTKVRTRD